MMQRNKGCGGREKKSGIMSYLSPLDIQEEVNRYGYRFSKKSYMLCVMATLAVAVLSGFLFCLKPPFILFIFAVCLLVMPGIVRNTYKMMYEQRRFSDVADYIEQFLYSFKENGKILVALEDNLNLFEEESRMYGVIRKAIAFINGESCEGNLYREALSLIEREYPNNRLHTVHEYAVNVEAIGGEFRKSADYLLADRQNWVERVYTLQAEKKRKWQEIIGAVAAAILLCYGILILNKFLPEGMSIEQLLPTQISAALLMAGNVLIFAKACKKMTESLIETSASMKKQQGQALRDYRLVMDYDSKKEKRKSLVWSAPFLAAAAVFAGRGHSFLAAAAGILGLVMLVQHRLGYRIAYDSAAKALNIAFPEWLMTMALLLQNNNVEVSIEASFEEAPAVLKPALKELKRALRESPGNTQAYKKFLKGFDLPQVQSAMRLLIALSSAGNGDEQIQIEGLMQQISKNMAVAEDIRNEHILASFKAVFMVPLLFASGKMLVDLAMFMVAILPQMANVV